MWEKSNVKIAERGNSVRKQTQGGEALRKKAEAESRLRHGTETVEVIKNFL